VSTTNHANNVEYRLITIPFGANEAALGSADLLKDIFQATISYQKGKP
jgi:hypothetical protein